MANKIFVSVFAKFNTLGQVIPASFEWEDGRVFEIDQILDIQKAASLKAGGMGVRYLCRVCGKRIYLYLEDSRWFIEAK